MKVREFLQVQGFSRRIIVSAIDAGQVFLDNQKVESYGQLLFDGATLRFKDQMWVYHIPYEQKKIRFLVFYKPIGYVCSKGDSHNATIYEILPEEYHSWYYIGRLDSNSRGLVLLTNDAKMVDQYEHPRYGITKEYLVTLNKPFRQEDVKRCLDGIDDNGDLLKCLDFQILDNIMYQKNKKFLLEDVVKNSSCVVKMVLNEGKKRHIRRMMSAMRYHVEDLVRIREGEFVLGDLKEGEVKVVL